MRVLLTGANGFIGAHLAAALSHAGHPVTALARHVNAAGEVRADRVIAMDLTRADLNSLERALQGVACVVNVAGSFADGAGDSTAVNDRGAALLFQACERAGVRRVLHFSVEEERTPFARTKLAGERALMATSLDWVILRPSIVLGAAQSGSGALIRGLAAQPFLPLGESGPIDVVRLDDVIETVVRLVTKETAGRLVLELAGPERLALGDIVARYRAWLGWPKARQLRAPGWMMSLFCGLGDLAGWLGWRSPIRSAARAELERGATGDAALWTAVTGVRPGTLEAALAAQPATLQDRRFAQFYFLKPLIMAVTSAFWIGTGIASLTFGYDIGVALLREGGVGALSGPSVIAGGWADILIGVGVAFRPTARLTLGAPS